MLYTGLKGRIIFDYNPCTKQMMWVIDKVNTGVYRHKPGDYSRWDPDDTYKDPADFIYEPFPIVEFGFEYMPPKH